MPTVNAGSLGLVRVNANVDTSGNVTSVVVARDLGLQGAVGVKVRDSAGAVVVDTVVTALSILPTTYTFAANRRPTEQTLQVELKWGRD